MIRFALLTLVRSQRTFEERCSVGGCFQFWLLACLFVSSLPYCLPRADGLPADSTEHSRSTHCKWDEIGEFLITELDYATITLKLNSADKDAREDVVAVYTADLNDFLEASLVSLAFSLSLGRR